jgi:hypothetical protein
MSMLGDVECLMDEVACSVPVFPGLCFKFFVIGVSKIGFLVMTWL